MNKASLSILMCDDNDDDRFFFKEALQQVAMLSTLTVVNNGEELMDYLSKNVQQLPGVIFLDLNMPRKNGFECLQEIKESKVFNKIPVIILSTTNYSDAIDTTYKAGAFLYIIKPSSISKLQREIEKSLVMIKGNPLVQIPKNKFVLKEDPNY